MRVPFCLEEDSVTPSSPVSSLALLDCDRLDPLLVAFFGDLVVVSDFARLAESLCVLSVRRCGPPPMFIFELAAVK
jgi:hypothetical protein